MKIDLFKIQEYNNIIKKEEENIEFKKEIKKLIIAIIDDKEIFKTPNIKLLEEMKIKYKTGKELWFDIDSIGLPKYEKIATIKLNKTNIKKINDYLNKGD